MLNSLEALVHVAKMQGILGFYKEVNTDMEIRKLLRETCEGKKAFVGGHGSLPLKTITVPRSLSG